MENSCPDWAKAVVQAGANVRRAAHEADMAYRAHNLALKFANILCQLSAEVELEVEGP